MISKCGQSVFEFEVYLKDKDEFDNYMRSEYHNILTVDIRKPIDCPYKVKCTNQKIRCEENWDKCGDFKTFTGVNKNAEKNN